jgi:hypothetical protein
MTKPQERIRNNSSLVWLRVSDLELAPITWGRPVRPNDVRQIGANIDPDLFGIPVVWERTDREAAKGRYVIIDGQHRVRAIVDVCGWCSEMIQCQVFRDISNAEAARLSLGHQERRNLHPFDHYRTAYAAGVRSAVGISKAASEAGLCITRRSEANNEVCAVSTMVDIWERVNTAGLARVLVIMREAWDGTPSSFSAKMLKLGMLLIANYENELDDHRLALVLGQQAPAMWLSENTPKRRHLGFIAQDVIMAYNHGLRANRLPERVPDEYVIQAKRTTKGKPRATAHIKAGNMGSRAHIRKREAGRAKGQDGEA